MAGVVGSFELRCSNGNVISRTYVRNFGVSQIKIKFFQIFQIFFYFISILFHFTDCNKYLSYVFLYKLMHRVLCVIFSLFLSFFDALFIVNDWELLKLLAIT
jgi:hypothetical protein